MTKHLLLFSLLVLEATVIEGAVALPEYSYMEDFKASLPADEALPEGWVSYGIGEVVGSSFQDLSLFHI